VVTYFRKRTLASDERRHRRRKIRPHCLARADRRKIGAQSRHDELIKALGTREAAQRVIAEIAQ
jgi:hypothetical protein